MFITQHPIHEDVYDLCQAIEKSGASIELTKALEMASGLHKKVDAIIEKQTEKTDRLSVTSDASGFTTASFSLPENHWLYQPNSENKPVPILTHALRQQVIDAVRFAVKNATSNGSSETFDPDALVQNAVLALCGTYS